MSIGLFCYVASQVNKVESILDSIQQQHVELFSSKFLISTVKEATAMHREISFEHGVAAQAFFLVTLNEKESADLVVPVANLVKQAFSESPVLVLLENESPL